MTTPFLMTQTDKDWHLLTKRLLSYQHYNIPSLSAFSTAQAGLVYNHDEQTLSCSDCDLLLRDVTTHFDAFALHLAGDPTKRCSYLNRYRRNPAHLSGKVLFIKVGFDSSFSIPATIILIRTVVTKRIVWQCQVLNRTKLKVTR